MSESGAFRRRAATEPGTVLLEDARSKPGRSLFFTDAVEWLEVQRLEELPWLFTRLEAARAAGLWAAGYVSYECGYFWEPTAMPEFVPAKNALPLAAFGLFVEPVIFASQPQQIPKTKNAGGLELDSRFDTGEAAFACSVEKIRRWIEAGDTYQANLTGRMVGQLTGDAARLFGQMMEAQPVEFGAVLRVGERIILSASPELFFRMRDKQITVRPMKGTATRGRDATEDSLQAEALANDAKNRAENVMIVDLLRNDLGRIAEMGSVQVGQLFRVDCFPCLLQMSSEISAVLRPEMGLAEVFGSLFPCGSIVGAPKVRTMQILRTLEKRDRGVYTGAIGCVAPGGEAVFSVAIRTAVIKGQRLEMGVGAGITYDSNAQSEYAECLLKGAFLREMPFALIETMLWENGHCPLLARHLARLRASAAYFGFRCEPERIRQAIEVCGASLPPDTAWKLRLTLDRAGEPVFQKPEPVLADRAPLKAILWPEPVNSSDRFLRHKTTRRALYNDASASALRRDYVDAIFVNERGTVTEGAVHNLIVRHGAKWRTPPLDAGVLPGVYRAHLLATMPDLVEQDVTVEELLAADEVWLTNAVRGVRRVNRVVRETEADMLSSEAGPGPLQAS
jgi:para-aminobenzoate synthetase/4-amino-4-deoxychorismate lyase